MRHRLCLLFLCLYLASCSSTKNFAPSGSALDYKSPNIKQEFLDQNTFKILSFSKDNTYGYNQKNPVMVGGALNSEGPVNERRFLNALAGPNGEEISYHRLGSCCDFSTKNSPFGGGGKLDRYSVSYDGIKEPVVLYINMYDSDTLKVPTGFKLKHTQ